jgi:hypothetical protein
MSKFVIIVFDEFFNIQSSPHNSQTACIKAMKFSDKIDNALTVSPILLWNTHSYLFALLSSKT